jgi:hypothetical protein
MKQIKRRLFVAWLSLGTICLFSQEVSNSVNESSISPSQESASSDSVSNSSSTDKPKRLSLEGLSPRNWNDQTRTQLAQSLLENDNWQESADILTQWMTQHYSPETAETPAWHEISTFAQFCDICSSKKKIKAMNQDVLSWLLKDPALTHDFVDNYDQQYDFFRGVLNVLSDLKKSEPTRFPKYNRLALAMAFVWDRPPPDAPHHQVPVEAISKDTSTVLQKFQFWVDMNESKKTQFDLSSLEVEQLKFIVDATAPLDELKWAHENVPLNRYNFDKIYFTIKYDEKRLKKNVYDWPHPSYALQEILKFGGICVDQAYYAAMVGKSYGIPTLYFVGQGRGAGHAWVGFMRDKNIWNMDCGRYRYDNFATGQAIDPQTRGPISDHVLAYLAESFRETKEYQVSDAHYQIARSYMNAKENDKALFALDQSIKACPRYLEPWKLKTDILETKPLDETYRKHLENMLVQFTRFTDERVDSELKLVSYSKSIGDEAGAKRMENLVITDNLSKRPDLSAEVYRRRIEALFKKDDWQGSLMSFRDAVTKLKSETGAIYQLLIYYGTYSIKHGHPADADKAISEFRSGVYMDPTVKQSVDGFQDWCHKTAKADTTAKNSDK